MADADAPTGTGRIVAGIAGFVALAAVTTTALVAIGSTTDPVAAADLVRFSSCAELEAWTTDAVEAQQFGPATTVAATLDVGANRAVEESVGAPTAAAAGESDDAGGAGGDTGGTNTVVAGVDEIDVIDRVGDDRLLVSRNGALALVDLTGRSVVAELTGVPWDARISVAGDIAWVAGSSTDGLGTSVRRIRIGADSLVEEGAWSTPGWLLDARRSGDRLHVVVVDQPYEAGVIPFEGGPVPCEDVWHRRPTARPRPPPLSLRSRRPARRAGAAAEVTGSGGNILVTGESLYVATETWSVDGGDITTGLHRFDLATLAPTGSGSVPGHVPGRFALDEHDGYLRVATTLDSFGFFAVEGDVAPMPAVDDAVVEVPAAEARQPRPRRCRRARSRRRRTRPFRATRPPPPSPTARRRPRRRNPRRRRRRLCPRPRRRLCRRRPRRSTPPAEAPEDALAEVFVLDTEGDLDVLGRTGRFGHDFETIQGVRFVDDVAYVVTFRQTDPFFVIDLADPAAPRSSGSSPSRASRPTCIPPARDSSSGSDLTATARSAPACSTSLTPPRPGSSTNCVSGTTPRSCGIRTPMSPSRAAGSPSPRRTGPPWPGAFRRHRTRCPNRSLCPSNRTAAPAAPARRSPPAKSRPFCEPEFTGGGTGAVVLDVRGGRLVEVDRATIETDGSVNAERIVLAPDGTWLLLSWDRMVPTDGGPAIVLPADPSTGIAVDE